MKFQFRIYLDKDKDDDILINLKWNENQLNDFNH